MKHISKLFLALLILTPTIASPKKVKHRIKKKIKRSKGIRTTRQAPATRSVRQAPSTQGVAPIVFHEKYDMGMFGIEKLHPFDSKKYGRVFEQLKISMKLTEQRIYKPEPVSADDLLLVHSRQYLESLNQTSTIADIAEVYPLRYVPYMMLRSFLLTPMRYATGGTVLAVQLALSHGWAINLSGGYHHAKADKGGGFCYFADIPLAIYKLWQTNPRLKVMIVDLDAHQGNGHEAICGPDHRVTIFDMYNADTYHRDYAVQGYINYNFPVHSGITDREYLSILKSELPKAIEQSKPDLIIYNAGTDIYEGDRLGRMRISAQGIMERDQFVFATAKQHNVPIAMVLSGGYTQQSAGIIAQSIEQILRNVVGIRQYGFAN